MLEEFLNPDAVAVVGASKEPTKVGHVITKNLIESEFKGRIIPVNPRADKILGLTCYSSIEKIEDYVDLAVIAVPAGIVPQVVEECGRKGVRGLIIVSAGFKEVGPEGASLERELTSLCRRFEMRMLGPNCLGLINTYTPLNASFASKTPLAGSIAFVSQSGALCTAILDWSLSEEIGFSIFVSLGNKADLDETDFIEALVEDKNTRVILVYIEAVGNGERFLKTASKATRKKPVIILKAGVTEAGARAASSHTGSIAGSDTAYQAAFRQTGIIRASSGEELFDLAEAFQKQPIPRGRNVAIITNAGGPGILAADACERYGLRLPSLNLDTVERLRKVLPPASNFHNPIDILGDADVKRYDSAINTVLSDPNIDSAIVILTPQAMTEPDETAKIILKAHKRYSSKPILTSFLGGEDVRSADSILSDGGIPSYPFPERAINSLKSLSIYGEYLKSVPEPIASRFKADVKKVEEIFSRLREERRVNLHTDEARAIVEAYGLRVPRGRIVASKEVAVKVAEEIGYPVVMKIASPQILHKTDIGCVKLNIQTSDEVKANFDEIVGNALRYVPGVRILGVEVQEMAEKGKEMIVGLTRDPQFGPLIMFGLGGIYVDLLRDTSFRLSPLSKREALRMVEETKAYTLLSGIRGEPPSDIDSVVETILRISQLATDFKEIYEMDINPLLVYERGMGCLALDTKITVGG